VPASASAAAASPASRFPSSAHEDAEAASAAKAAVSAPASAPPSPRFPSSAHEDAEAASAAEAAACAPGSTGVCSARQPDYSRAGTSSFAGEQLAAGAKAGLAEAAGATSRLNVAESAFYGRERERGRSQKEAAVGAGRDPDNELLPPRAARPHSGSLFEAPLDILDAAEQASWTTVTERTVVSSTSGEVVAPLDARAEAAADAVFEAAFAELSAADEADKAADKVKAAASPPPSAPRKERPKWAA
jgi:hypothetical protein